MIDLIGQKFERLLVIQEAGKNKWNQCLWLCQCDCGNRKIIAGGCLKSGDTKSCGCLRKEIVTARNTQHNHDRRNKPSKIYKAWQGMVQRCTDQNCRDYLIYGGRGIIICDEWLKFPNFLKDIGEPPTDKHQIDRIDNDKGYYKENCRWVTPKEQQRNKRNNRLETHNEKTQCLGAWAEEYKIDYQLLWKRICIYNWPIDKALTTPVRKREMV